MNGEKVLFRLEQPHGNGDLYIAWQNGSGNYLATTGLDSTVNIFDRYGQIKERIRLQSLCNGFAWDQDGDLLAIIYQSSQLILWDANVEKKLTVDIGLRDILTYIVWAKTGPILAIGTAKGNVSIYNHNTSRRIPVIGKHSKKITCGAWNIENLLALGSEDKTISISNIDGDTLRVVAVRSEPADLQFSEMKLDERVGGENTVSVIVGKRTLYLYNLTDPENPVELAFQQHYGSIVTYKWFGDGYILIGFSGGFFIAISTHIKEVGQELFQIRNHKVNLTDVAISNAVGKVASCGDNTVKIHDLSNLQETSTVINLSQEIGVDRVAWSSDGQLLAVCTHSGSLNVYVSHMPTLVSVCGARMAILSSLTEVSLFNFTTDKSKLVPVVIQLETEPSFIAVGPYHLAVGLNNRAWIYDLTRSQPYTEDAPLMLKEMQYLGGITSMKLNAEYASVLYEGKIQMHMIEQPDVGFEEKESIIFPNDNNISSKITCHCLTTDFLVYGTDMGHIIYFCIEEWANSSEYKHAVGITDIFVDPGGTRLIFMDSKKQCYLYNVVNGDVLIVPDLPTTITGVTWDSNISDRNIFIMFDEHDIFTYVYVKFSVYGASIQKIGRTSLVSKQIPLLMYNGSIMSATTGGQLSHITLSTHDSAIITVTDNDVVALENNFNKQLALHRFTAAWNTCQLLNSQEHWKRLAKKAVVNLELDIAVRIYKILEDTSMALAVEDIMDIDDLKLLAGYIAMFLNDFDHAQQWFLKSTRPEAALEMRRDLLQGNYPEAFLHYEKGLQDNKSEDHTFICKSGIARTAIRSGNFKHGINVAIELNNFGLYKECAEILESKKQLVDAAIFYEKAQSYEKSALCYIKQKNWQKVGDLLPHITSTKIHLQYAKAKERDGKYEDAVKSYSIAKDFDSVIRLQLDYLNNPEVAVDLVQETKSVEGAKLVAKFFQKLNDYPSAIKFLVLSRCSEEAFELARRHHKLDMYGEILLNTLSTDEIKPEDFTSLAVYFENERNYLLAGRYFYHSKDYHKAMKHLLRAAKSNSDENEAISSAIDVVASSNEDQLANQLIEFLLGETDGMPKDPKHLFRLYMARKQYKEAAKSALIIANEEQINGNYRNAHDVLFAMYQELRHNGIKVPYEMYSSLMLLHSYILVRLHVRKGDHLKGARMLIRVANNISKFPSHIVPILTSTVIECHRADLKLAAYKYATMLMNPEYRRQIDSKYAKKIEAVGRHIVKDDLTVCPECDFPAILSEFKR
ncbi:osmotic avoidance abnormal protein 1/wd repeat membrane protein [Holotrichia oblita]|uniref:Osmotic avoidance abnormal protein 1/wd repeat membrane protein n=1 Tax=Holotrichia oblita TaxID=644536 RepID=A0ACB9T787_HOLOL|nr:osmotic avoidance abnormal protein 1/wd repeat membrane protein [Holotrichia oblita]